MSCRVFNNTYNPERVRLGSHIMRQRLKGASVASYYPPRIGTISQLRSLYPENEILDDEEEDWLEHLNVARSRGKATPKKKRTAAGTFMQKHRKPDGIVDNLQSRRSSTRGSKRTHATRYSARRDTVHLLYQKASGGVLSTMANTGFTHIPKTRTYQLSALAHSVPSLVYILLFSPISVFPFTTPHSFSNSSSHGILAFRCSGSTGAFTL